MAERPAWHTDLAAVVLHPSEPTVWIPSGRDPALPVLRLSHDGGVWYGNAETIIRLVRETWGLDTVLLRSPAYSADRVARDVQLSLLLQAHPEAMPAHGRWLPAAEVKELMAGVAGAELISAAVRELEQPLSGSRTPWYERGWFAQAMAWADAALAANGLARQGLPGQHRSWGLSHVVRLETDGGTVYFKAAAFDGAAALTGDGKPQGILFSNEAALLAGLTGRFPDLLPRLLAFDPDRVWLLLPEFGPMLDDSTDVAIWEAALRLHARHQRAYVGKEADLADFGCLSRPLDRLRVQFDALLLDDDVLAFLEPPDRARLHAIAEVARASIVEAAACGIPDTLVHGDLHAGNVAIGDGKPIFFDWTDASIGHPFLDLATFLQPSRLFEEAPDVRDRLRAAYLDEWRGVAAPGVLDRAADLMLPVGMIHQVVSYQYIAASLTGPDRDDVGRGAAHWLGELIAWAEGSATPA